MTVDQIARLGSALSEFLGEFADCFGRCEPRWKLAKDVRGQLSELPRKSAEPMPQVHAATNALIESLPLPSPARRCWLQHTADTLTHWQQRNQQARISHLKPRLQELESVGISLPQIPQCRPG